MNAKDTEHGIQPMSFFVLVKPFEVEEKTSGGIILPDDVKKKDEWAQTRGEMLAIGPCAFLFEDWPAGKPKPKIGDTVFFARYSSVIIQGNDKKDYWIIKDADIMATIHNV